MPLPAEVIVRQSEDCADAWVRAAEANATIRRALEGFSTASVFGALLMAHIPIAVAFQVQLGRLPINHPIAGSIKPEIERTMGMSVEEAIRRQQEAQDGQAAPASA